VEPETRYVKVGDVHLAYQIVGDGPVELAGGRIRGIAVHIGSRVASLAERDEVVVSSTVHDLVAGSGILFSDRGTHGLKGVPGEWHLFAAAEASPA